MGDPVPLNYASPEPTGEQSWIIAIPASFLFLLLQIPWFFVFAFVEIEFAIRMGQPKSIVLDGCNTAMIIAPSIAAFAFSLREFRRFRWRKDRIAPLIVSIVTLGVAMLFIGYMFLEWYRDVWLDPTGRWGWL